MDTDSDDQFSSDENSSDEEISSSSDEEINGEEVFIRNMRRVRNNDPHVNHLCVHGEYDIVQNLYDIIQNLTSDEWEDFGRVISENAYLLHLEISQGALNDEKLSSLFRGLSGRSSSIVELELVNNEYSAAGLRSLESFLQNSINLRWLDVSDNDIQTEGFNILFQALRDSPIERLYCYNCGITSFEIETVPNNLIDLGLNGNIIQSEGFNRLLRLLRDSSIEILQCESCDIESIEIEIDSFPKNLKTLDLLENGINSSGCDVIAQLLREEDNTLEDLYLRNNLIDDEGAGILADALKTNTSLKHLDLRYGNDISNNGGIKMLELVTNISSIKETLRSNHTLQEILISGIDDDINGYIMEATDCNREYQLAAGREKVIQTQLHSKRRAALVEIQGVRSESVYGKINPLHLPEVLSLVGCRHGQEELYLALKASIAGLLSTVNIKLSLLQRRAHYVAIVTEIDAALAAIESAEAEGGADDVNESRGNKRLRV